MGRYKKWLIGAAVIVVLAVGLLAITGTLGSVYRWLVRYFQPEVWSAIAAWFTFAIAVGAFLYAKQQVYQAKQARIDQEKQSGDALTLQAKLARESNEHQAKLARESLEQQAKLARESLEQQATNLREQIVEQARIAQLSLDEQSRQAQLARDELAQPNVVIYAEPMESDWQILEVIVKNFGNTPAYAVTIILDSPIQSLPNNVSDGENYDIPIPIEIPTLVPGQQWTTVWDSAVERRERRRLLRSQVIQRYPGGPPTGTDIEAEVETFMPRSRHNATVQYTDSKGKIHKTKSFLDFNMLDGSMRAKTYGLHDIAKKYVNDD